MGSKYQVLSDVARVTDRSTQHGISLRCVHIARKIHDTADALSRTPDKHYMIAHHPLFK